MADTVKTPSKVVTTLKEFIPSTGKQWIGTSVLSVAVGGLSFVVGRLTKGAKAPKAPKA